MELAEIDAATAALTSSITARPRATVATGKALFYRQLERGLPAACEDAGTTLACHMTDDAVLEGVHAFIEKRPPIWRR